MPALTQRPGNLHTLAETIAFADIAAAQSRAVIDNGDVVSGDWRTDLAAEALVYGQTRRFDFRLLSLKGRATRKCFHVTIYRTTEGRYELNTYVL